MEEKTQPVTDHNSQRKSLLNRRRIILFGCGGLVVAAVGRQAYLTPPSHSNTRLSVGEAYAQAQAGDITLVDIRTPKEWQSTGVPVGSHPIDMRRDDFVDALSELVGGDRDARVALICARGVRSARMTLRLSEAGFTHVIDVPEGMLGSEAGPGWIRTKLPIDTWAG